MTTNTHTALPAPPTRDGRRGVSACMQDEWYVGMTCDHLYADCPGRKRGETELRRVGWWDPPNTARSNINPHGGDVCGMCLYRHNRSRHGRATAKEHANGEGA